MAKALCQNLDPALEDVNDGMGLGDDRVMVQIAESLSEDHFPYRPMWSFHLWDTKQVFLDGVSLYDHVQTHAYNVAIKALNQRRRKGVRFL